MPDLAEPGSAVFIMLKVRGLWSVNIINFLPSRKYLKCFTPKYMASSSLSKVLYLVSGVFNFLLKKLEVAIGCVPTVVTLHLWLDLRHPQLMIQGQMVVGKLASLPGPKLIWSHGKLWSWKGSTPRF